MGQLLLLKTKINNNSNKIYLLVITDLTVRKTVFRLIILNLINNNNNYNSNCNCNNRFLKLETLKMRGFK